MLFGHTVYFLRLIKLKKDQKLNVRAMKHVIVKKEENKNTIS